MFPAIDFFDDFNETWADLESLCICWGDKIHKVPDLENFFRLNDSVRDDARFFYKPYYVILRTTYQHANIVDMLYTWFSKLFKIEVAELSWDEVKFYNALHNKKTSNLRAYLVEFKVLRPNLWETNSLAKLVYYSLVLLELLDHKFCPTSPYSATSLDEILHFLLFDNDRILENNLSSFFHRELGELIITIKNLRLRERSGNWRLLRDVPSFIAEDINGIPFTLQSRHDINEVLNRVTEYNATKITNEIFVQYETMRRNF